MRELIRGGETFDGEVGTGLYTLCCCDYELAQMSRSRTPPMHGDQDHQAPYGSFNAFHLPCI